ncbi:MAG: large repetitive protein, partial [Pseudonocardiales bacterium]|nr:large repetitive protein [Pseudonocardiales bacterium]
MADLTGGFGSEPAPGIALLPMARTGAGSPVTVQLRATNHAPEPRILSVTALGVDAGWLPRPVRTRPIMPGLDTTIELEISPSIGTVPARYPLVVAVQALDPVSGGATAPTAMGELTLVVDGPGQVSIDLQPADVTARVSRRITVLLRNTSSAPAEVTLDVQAPPRARVRLKADRIELAPNSDTKISGRVRVRRPRLIGQRSRHPYSITARSSGAPRYATGSVTERAFLGSGGAKLGILAALVAVWVVLALVAIPKLAQSTKNKQTAGPAASATGSTSAPGGSAGGSGAGGTSAGSAGSGGTAGSGGAAGTAGAAKNVRLNGSITGAAPNGVTVSLRPTSLVDEQAEGATPIGISSRALQVRGLVPQSALYRSVPLTATSTRTAASRTAASR